MRKLFLYAFFSLSSFFCYSQNWKWVADGGGLGNDEYWAIKLSKDHANVYAAGPFEQTAKIGSTFLTSAGSADILLSKYDTAGNVVWAKRIGGGAGYDAPTEIFEDDSSHIYVFGVFQGKAGFGSDTLLAGASGDGAFYAKYDSNGQQIWIKQMHGNGICYSGEIRTDMNGDLLISGQFSDSLSIDTITIVSKGLGDCFLAKLSPNGNVHWVRTAGGTGDDGISGMNVDKNNNIMITGYFTDNAMFGSNAIIGTPSQPNAFVSKYSSSGTNLWVKSGGGNARTYGSWITSDLANNYYVVGYFYGTVHFDSTALTSAGKDDIFIARYDANGNRKWAKRLGDVGYDEAYYSVTDNSGNSFLTGRYTPTISGIPNPNSEFLVAKIDSSGILKWLKTSGMKRNAYGESSECAFDNSNNLYVGGFFQGINYFDSDSVVCNGGWDMCLAKLHDSTGIVSSITDLVEPIHVTIYPNPCIGEITLDLSGVIFDDLTISISNVLGQEMQKSQIKATEEGHIHTTIILPGLPSGIYLVQIKYGSRYVRKKIIVKA